MPQNPKRKSSGSSPRKATPQRRHRRAQFEALEVRVALHAGHDHDPPDDPGPEPPEHEPDDHASHVDLNNWLDHMLYDNGAVDATAAGVPQPDLLEAQFPEDSDAADTGEWSPLQNWPIEFINALMLPTGKVMGYDRTMNLRLWDPLTNTFTSPADPGYNLFCTGTALLADGTVLVTGGHVVDTVGLPYASIYDPFQDSWTQLANMNAGRWYPSQTTLANGDVLVLSGDTNGDITDPLPQIYEAATGTWRDLTTAELTLSFYPRTFSAPNGAAFVAGPDPLSQYLDVTGTGQWIPVDYRIEPNRSFGSAVMYAPGKVLYVGGGSPATATAEVIDLNEPSPQWRAVSNMAFPRRNGHATLLPNGEVLVVGGNTGVLHYDGDAVLAAEIWNPVTETFRTVENMDDVRWYHSVAVLLPDGRVLSTSGDLHLTGQVYSPPYLFQGDRPTISSAPETLQYGDSFFVGTPDAAEITKVSWVRMGTATHAQDWDQYIQEAVFTETPGGLMVTAPPTANTAPPGYYMLFILNGDVPSVAKTIRVGTMLPEVSVSRSSTAEGPNGGTTEMVFTVSLALSSAETVTVPYTTFDQTALAGQDYVAQAGTLTFAPLEKVKTVTVQVLGDLETEAPEEFDLNIYDPVGAVLFEPIGQGIIRDFGSLPVLTIDDVVVVEGDAGTSNAVFTVTLSAPPAGTPVTVQYSTADGTATAGQSYLTTAGTLTFSPGVTTQTIAVPIIGDTMDEFNNSFLLNLTAPVGADLEDAQGLGLIYNNDDPVTANFIGTEVDFEPIGSAAQLTFTVALSAASGKPVEVFWTTQADGTAKPGVNFVEQVGHFVMAPGTTTATFNVTVLDDGVRTTDRTFSVIMQSELTNANYGDRYTFALLVDTDTLPALSLSKPEVTEGLAGSVAMVFTVSLTAAADDPVVVNYATSAGTATPGVDYTETSGVITFAPGITSQLITVSVAGDGDDESNETFNLTLSNPVNATLAGGLAVGTILDDDGAASPAVPQDLTAEAGFARVTLRWDAVAGASGYQVYRGTTPGGAGTTPIAGGIVGTEYTDTGLTNGTDYYYWVTAVQGAIEGSASAEVHIVPTAYDFSEGFPGRSLDPTVPNALGSAEVLSLNGYNIHNVRLFGTAMQLTDGGSNQRDSVFTRQLVDVRRFTTHFSFQQIPSLGYVNQLADGMTFTIQTDGPTALGGSGGGLGFSSIPNSLAIKFDLYDNTGEGFNSTGLYTNGAYPSADDSIDLTGGGIDFHSGHLFDVSMEYDGTTLRVTITDTVTLGTATQEYVVDIPTVVGGDLAHVGFTGGTGGLSAVQRITNWIFTPAPAVPTGLQVTSIAAAEVALAWTNVDPNASGVIVERRTGLAGTYEAIGGTLPAGTATFADATVAPGNTYYYRVRAVNGTSPSEASNEVEATPTGDIDFPDGFDGFENYFVYNGPTAAQVDDHLQVSGGGMNEATSIFWPGAVDVTAFSTEFEIQLLPGTVPMADGMTFTIQGVGPTALGATGGSLGYAGIPTSLAIKFDLYDNTGEGFSSTGLYLNGAYPSMDDSIDLTAAGLDLHSGHVFAVSMTYDGTTLEVTITDTVTLATATQLYEVDIPAAVGGDTAYVGFTAGTGGFRAVQNVLNWVYTPGFTPPAISEVVGRHIFYNQSAFDGNNPAINAADDGAIAPDKTAYLPGDGLAGFQHITSYARGINGIIVDLSTGGNHASLGVNDFAFKVGANNSPDTWGAAPAPSAITVRTGAGLSGSDRVEITWANGAIVNQWLEVQVLATANTGLAAPDVFFWGNRLGDTGAPTATSFTTTTADASTIIAGGLGGAGGITNVRDIDKSNTVTVAGDRAAALGNIGALNRLNVGTGGPFAPQASALANSSESAGSGSANPGEAGIAFALAALAAAPADPQVSLGTAAVQETRSVAIDARHPSVHALHQALWCGAAMDDADDSAEDWRVSDELAELLAGAVSLDE
ncbi:MAG: Calx-beta domain-containing protein [Pirellulales bacterium]